MTEAKWPDDLSFSDLVDWAAGYILTELIAGKLRAGVWFALDVTTRWRMAREAVLHTQAPPPKEVWVLLEPGDYQRATIMGVYASEAEAEQALETERENLHASGDKSWSYLTLDKEVVR